MPQEKQIPIDENLRSKVAAWLTSLGRKCPYCRADAGEYLEVIDFRFTDRLTRAEPPGPIDTTPEWIHQCKLRCRKCENDGFAPLVLEDVGIEA